jgi:hypothetical protein
MEMDRAGRHPEKKKFHLQASTGCLSTTERQPVDGNSKRTISGIHIEPDLIGLIDSSGTRQKLPLTGSEQSRCTMTSGIRLTLASEELIGSMQAEDSRGIVIYCRPAWDQGNCLIEYTDGSGRKVLRYFTIELSYTFPTKEWKQPDSDPNETSELNSSSPWTA